MGDFVWFDNDGDGTQDANEPGIPGITVTYTKTDNLLPLLPPMQMVPLVRRLTIR
ncbi:MAG: hypothetical protein IPN94_23045 [Sphingobacteriales bacterium]|nr:hypothetical protein [Sphingobacteriales bacterium]